MPTTTDTHFTRIIRDQVGLATLMAVGAKDFAYNDLDGDRYLRFAVKGQRGYVTAVKVILEPSDTYTVELVRMHKRTFEFEVVKSSDLVYADALAQVVRALVVS